MEFLTYISHNSDRVLQLTIEHLELVGVAIFAATAVGIPLGVAASRNTTLKRWSLGFANVTQTIPSLALFGFLIPATGIGARTAVIALALYALLPILQNTCVGIAGVDRAVIEAARGMRSLRAEKVLSGEEAWYLPLGLITALFLLALSGIAFRISLGGTRLLKDTED